MNFSDLLLQYIQKHYSPISTRIVHILIIASIAISSAILLRDITLQEWGFYVMTAELTAFAILLIIFIPGQQNNSVEKLEKAIILNVQYVDDFDDKMKKESLEKIDKLFSYKHRLSGESKKYKVNLRDCQEFFDPENKSTWIDLPKSKNKI